jgi:hypothetical protein
MAVSMLTLHSPKHPEAQYEIGDGGQLNFTGGYKTMTPAQWKKIVEVDPDRWNKLVDSGEIVLLKEGTPLKTSGPDVGVKRADGITVVKSVAQEIGKAAGERELREKPPEKELAEMDPPTPVKQANVDHATITKPQT